MEAIYYKDGVYVLIHTDVNNDAWIYSPYKKHPFLYGGRVKILAYNYQLAYFYVDGIPIIDIAVNAADYQLRNSKILSHLNAIETNGVDAFLENYKKSIEYLYAELKELNQKA